MTDMQNKTATSATNERVVQSNINMSEEVINGIAEACSLRDVCYEQITPRFWHALYGELKLIVDTETGYFNATKLCSQGGKQFAHWVEKKRSKVLTDELHKLLTNTSPKKSYTIYGKQITSGTYVKEELILDIASWISIEFYIKIHNITKSYFIQKFAESSNRNNEKLKMKLDEIQSRCNQLQSRCNQLEHDNNQIQNKYNQLEHENNQTHSQLHEMRTIANLYGNDIAPKTIVSKKLNMLSIVKKNKMGSEYPYYAIRCQKRVYMKSVRDLREKYPDMTIVHEIRYNPNAINLFNRMKEHLLYINTKYNHLKVDNIHKLIYDIERLIPHL